MVPISHELLARCDDKTRDGVAVLHWAIQLDQQSKAGPQVVTRAIGHLMRVRKETVRLADTPDRPDWLSDAVASLVSLPKPPDELDEPATDLAGQSEEPPGHRASALPHLRALAPPAALTRGQEIAA